MRDKNLRDVAYEKYIGGESPNQISLDMGVPTTTIEKWLAKYDGQNKMTHDEIEKRRGARMSFRYKQQRKTFRESGRNKEVNALDILVCGIYLGEGDKSTGQWGITNSDPEIIRASRDWLLSMNVAPENISMSIRAYQNSETSIGDIISFWSDTGQNKDFIKAYTASTHPNSNGTRVPNVYGTCKIKPRGRGAELYEIIMGIADQVLGRRVHIKGGMEIHAPDSIPDHQIGRKIENLVCKVCGKEFIGKHGGTVCSGLCGAASLRRFNVDRADLENLVWSHPTTEVAKMYGVSDSAISKRCKLLGVKKPPRGYWTKIKYGKIEQLMV